MQQPAQPQPTSDPRIARNNKLKLIWGLICLLGPTALIILAILLYALINFTINTSVPDTGSADLFAEPSPAQTIGNIVLFLTGAIAVLSWLPGIVVGIVLLATRKPA